MQSLLRTLASVILVVGLLTPAHAVRPSEVLKDPKQEQRARNLSAQLRCLVCQNQSIDDSEAPLARDLRVLVRERIKAGDNDEQVMKYLVARYGDFILLKPPVNTGTLLLWGSPVLILFAGLAVIFFTLRRRRAKTAGSGGLDAHEEAALQRILTADRTE